jgi:ribokinase
MTSRVIVIGSINVDLVVTAGRLPHAGETVIGGRFARHDGGKGGNQAVAAARLGAPTWLVAAVGDDAFGAGAREALAAEGVRLDEVLAVAGEPTGVALIVVAEGGENLIAVASGANAALDQAHVTAALGRLGPRPGDVVLVGHEIPTAAARAALRLARANGATTILNPAPAGDLDRGTFALADILTPNRQELATLVAAEWHRLGRPGSPPGDPAIAARTLLERNAQGDGPGAVLVTLGDAGALLLTGAGGPEEIHAPAVAAVDAVGAGDALNGALAAALAMARPLGEAARLAVTAASMSTTQPGARGGLPGMAALEAQLAGRAGQVLSPD